MLGAARGPGRGRRRGKGRGRGRWMAEAAGTTIAGFGTAVGAGAGPWQLAAETTVGTRTNTATAVAMGRQGGFLVHFKCEFLPRQPATTQATVSQLVPQRCKAEEGTSVRLCVEEEGTPPPPPVDFRAAMEAALVSSAAGLGTGSALYTLPSMLNHSCDPSMDAVWDGGDATLTLRARREIVAGEELTITYIDADSPVGGSLRKSIPPMLVLLLPDASYPPPQTICMRVHAEGQSCSTSGRVLVLNDPPAGSMRGAGGCTTLTGSRVCARGA